jgi:hypothetical protein
MLFVMPDLIRHPPSFLPFKEKPHLLSGRDDELSAAT